MKLKTRIISVLLLLSMLMTMIPVTALMSIASGSAQGKEDAMTAIEADNSLAAFKQGETKTLNNDGYIGIPVEVTVYYDYATWGAAKPGYNGTAVILYIVNSHAERVGTDSDVEIINSMLSRGYVVAVCDYQNNAKAVSPDLEYSAQKVRTKLKNGDFFTNKTVFPNGTYYENHAVPAGHNISLNHVFYEIDKHGTDGVLERIVHVWNEDFRGCKRDVIIKWVDENGNRKTTQSGFGDNTTPVWYADAAGTTVDNENGQYTKIQYTKAMSITDCVKKDGTPIDYNLYMHIIYPTNPANDVPVMTLSCSSEHLASGTAAEDRPYLVGYSMQGYAIATFDFEYIPMSRNDHYGYFSGDSTGGITGTNGTFALGSYNRSSFQTAAMRYLRYLSINDHETFSFNNDKFGIYGNSKGGFQTFLGAAALRESTTLADLAAGATKADLEAYIDNKVATFYNDAYITAKNPTTNQTEGFNGHSRYQNGNTQDVVVGSHAVDGGELQPWLTYTDGNGVLREIPSGVQWVYSSCGGTASHEWKDHSPAFTAANYYDSFGSGYSTHNYLENCFRIYDVPSLFFEAPLEHNIVSGNDVNYGVDTYLAMFKASHYYLKDTPVSVVYTVPANASAGVKTTDDITIRFYGPVSAEDIATVTIKDANGNAAKGTWESGYGKTQWTFHPSALNGGVKYTVTVPATLKGDNGKVMGADHTITFYTNAEGADVKNTTTTVTNSNGVYLSFTVPTLDSGDNRIKLRFKVANDAANVANIYKASSESDTTGGLLGSVNLKGVGYYEYDVTDYVMGKAAGSTVYFLVKAKKAPTDTQTYKHDFDTKNDLTTYRTTTELVTTVAGEAVTALKMANNTYGGWYPHVLTNAKGINGGAAVTKADYGRRFTVTLRVYDTTSRSMQIWFNDCTDGSKTTGDYDYTRAVVQTVANQWMEITVPYVVYEMDYGIESVVKQIRLIAYSTGSTEMPYYLDTLTVTEHVTAIEMTESSLVTASLGSGEYKAPASETMYWEVNGTQCENWWKAIEKTSNNADPTLATTTIKLLRDYDFNSSKHSGDKSTIASRKGLTIDLNGYTVRLTDTSLINVGADNADTFNYVIKNGTVIIDGGQVFENLRSKAAGEGKIYNMAFENVTFEVADNSTLLEIFVPSTSPDGATIKQNFTFTDCVFNVDRTNLPKAPTVLFPSGTKNVVTTYKFIGGSINLTSVVKFAISDAIEQFSFEQNAGGKYTTISVSEWNDKPIDSFVRVGAGYKHFALAKTENHVSTYELKDPKYSTPYGVIPDEYDPENYPFAVFIDGKFIGAYPVFYTRSDSDQNNVFGVLWKSGNMRGQTNKTAYVVLRRDYDMSANSTNNGFDNIGQLGGNIVFDLGNYKITTTTSASFIPITAKYGYDSLDTKTDHIYPLSMSFINGTIDTKNSLLILYNSLNCDTDSKKDKYDKAKIIDVTFDNVDFVIGNRNFVQTSDAATQHHGADLTLDFVNCDFDLTANTSAITLFGAKDSNLMHDLSVNINGGNFKANTLANVTMSLLDADDSVAFVKTGGEYKTTLTVPSSYTLPSFGASGDAGMNVVFGGSGTVSGSNTVYGLVESGLMTKYGVIPSEYQDKDAYPVVVFDGKGNFHGAYSVWSNDNNAGNALYEAKNLSVNGCNPVVLLRKDYKITTSYNNLCQARTIIFDLGGYTLSSTQDHIFKASCKRGYVYSDIQGKKDNWLYTTNVYVINGNIEITKQLVFEEVTEAVGTEEHEETNKPGKPKDTNFFFEEIGRAHV